MRQRERQTGGEKEREGDRQIGIQVKTGEAGRQADRRESETG